MNEMQALESFISYKGQLYDVSASKFDGLVSVEFMALDSNSYTQVPGLRNMRSLHGLWLQGNKITKIAPGDFVGATRLVMLGLGGNSIVSVATEVFANLPAFRVTPEEFNPTNPDGTPYTTSVGIGAYC